MIKPYDNWTKTPNLEIKSNCLIRFLLHINWLQCWDDAKFWGRFLLHLYIGYFVWEDVNFWGRFFVASLLDTMFEMMLNFLGRFLVTWLRIKIIEKMSKFEADFLCHIIIEYNVWDEGNFWGRLI